jgi:hypothetical protein
MRWIGCSGRLQETRLEVDLCGRIPALVVTEIPALTPRGINDARRFGSKSAEQRQFAVAQPIYSGVPSRMLRTQRHISVTWVLNSLVDK